MVQAGQDPVKFRMSNSPVHTLSKTQYPTWLIRELRSDHAGETGAVFIYRGILALSRDEQVRHFASHHLATEEKHLQAISSELDSKHISLYLPVWKLAGFMTGAIPALFGRNAVYATIEAVETFVDRHYQQQIVRLEKEGIFPELKALLTECREDEVAHRDEAHQAADPHRGSLLRLWCWLVGTGSEYAVSLARFR